MSKKAVILFSGGVDSTTCLAIAKSQGFECLTLSFDYGQRHLAELEAAKKIAAYYQVAHRVFPLPISQWGGSALTDLNIAVPSYKEDTHCSIPSTYVPARNTIFLSVAMAWAEVIGAHDIFLGINAVDYSNYPDCRPAYLEAFQALANLATKKGVKGEKLQLHAPLLHLSKAEIIRLGTALGVDYAQTISCYQTNSQGQACKTCDSCTFRQRGFQEAGVPDPTKYIPTMNEDTTL